MRSSWLDLGRADACTTGGMFARLRAAPAFGPGSGQVNRVNGLPWVRRRLPATFDRV